MEQCNFVVKHFCALRRVRKGWQVLVKKRIGDLTFTYWQSKPFGTKSAAEQAGDRLCAALVERDAEAGLYPSEGRRVKRKRPRQQKRLTYRVQL